MTPVVRDLTSSDAPSVVAILESARAQSQVSIGPQWSTEQITAECAESGLVIESQNGHALQINGFILWRDNGEAWEISFLATQPELQRQGLMRALMTEMKRKLPSDRAIWLEVHAENSKARGLYERLGFKITGERPRYYSDGGAAVLYSLIKSPGN